MQDIPVTDTAPRLGYDPLVAAPLEGLLIDIWSVQQHPGNVRRGNVEAIAKSLKTHGQQKPIVVQKSTMNIVAGNHVWQAAHRLGWGKIAASIVEMDDEEAFRYLLDDNRSSDFAEYDRDLLIGALQKLADGPGLQDTLWDADALDDLYAEGTTTPFEQFTGGYAVTEEQIAARQEAREAASGTTVKMREVPVVLTVEEHQIFMAQVKALKGVYGTQGTIDTIVAAVSEAHQNYFPTVQTPSSPSVAADTEAVVAGPGAGSEAAPMQSSGDPVPQEPSAADQASTLDGSAVIPPEPEPAPQGQLTLFGFDEEQS